MLQKLQAKVIKKKDLTHDVMLLKFGLESTVSAVPGQYMIVFVPSETEQPYRRLYSITSDTSNLQTFDIVAKIIPGGVASEYFKKIHEGDTIHIEGPAGVFHLKIDTHDKMFLATGTGIAPIKAMINELLNGPDAQSDRKIYLLWGLRAYQDVYFLEDFKKLMQEHNNFNFTICLSREKSLDIVPEEDRKYFSVGRITDYYDKEGFQLTNTDFYLCGDRLVIESLRQYLYDRGFNRDAVIFEKF